ncbi:MAG: PA14 domain-containing protein [Chloroflexota bacterium]
MKDNLLTVDKRDVQARRARVWGGVVLLVGGVFVLLLSGITAVSAQSGWLAVYWNNTDLAGSPALIRPEFDDNHNPGIHNNWGLNSPDPLVNKDYFSARWTRSEYLEPGRYRFTASADDGVRVWVNDQMLIDAWLNQVFTTYTSYLDITGGVVPIRVEYYENQHQAVVHVSWTRVPGSETAVVGPNWSPAPGGWRGEYYNNLLFVGPPNLVRTDPEINFDWALESPAPANIVRDRFAVRWTNTLNLEPGRYRFTTTSDDGVRLWLNNELRIDQWHSQTSLAHSAELDVTGPLSVKLEYYDEIGLAEARLTWERLDGGAVPAPAALPAAQAPSGSMPGQDNTPTATVINANHLNVRSGPGMGYEPFTHLSHNDEVTMLARDAAAAWIQIRLPDGGVGWVASGFLLSPIPKVSLPVAN